MKIKGELGTRLSGKLNDGYYAAYYPERGESYLKHTPRKRKESEWTEKQKNARLKLAALSSFASINLYSLVKPIWTKFSVDKCSGYNLVQKMNKHAFNDIGELADRSLIIASIGDLPMPMGLSIDYCADNNSVNIYWNNKSSGERAYDILSFALFIDEFLIQTEYTNIYRSSGIAKIALTDKVKTGDYIYVYFSNRQKQRFSKSIAISL